MRLPNRATDLYSCWLHFYIPVQFSLLMFGLQEVSYIGQKFCARNLGMLKQDFRIKTTGISHHVMPLVSCNRNFCGMLGTCVEAGMGKPLLISGRVAEALFSPVTLQWVTKSSLYSFPMLLLCEVKAWFIQCPEFRRHNDGPIASFYCSITMVIFI